LSEVYTCAHALWQLVYWLALGIGTCHLNSQADLRTDDASVRIVACASSIFYDNSEGHHGKGRSCYNERLETTNF
jgi:hypothetical protein